jgi:sn-glycerol 3-phosphate transport system ATP-binding protein
MAAHQLKNVVKRYGSGKTANQVIHGVNAEIADGEFVVIVGPSGCGKSTCCAWWPGWRKSAAARSPSAAGRQRPGAGRARHRHGVPELRAVSAHERVRQHGLRPEDRQGAGDEIRARVDKAAKILELGALPARKPRELSGGQRQRVAMGRAIVRQPQVFLFDEPLSNLDAKLRAQTRLEIQKLHRELGITSLFVTHDQVEAMTLAQRMIVMNAGVMEQFGTPEEVYTRPATTFVASFIGSPPMNLLRDAPMPGPDTIVGIRPEHLDVTHGGWALRVEAVEMLGAERLVYGRWSHGSGDEMVIVRTDEAHAVPAWARPSM